jgi:hypothetical protein
MREAWLNILLFPANRVGGPSENRGDVRLLFRRRVLLFAQGPLELAPRVEDPGQHAASTAAAEPETAAALVAGAAMPAASPEADGISLT